MGEKYISPYDTIGKMREEIKQQSEKAGRLLNARYGNDSITFPQWIEMLTNYIEELQEDKAKAQRELAEFKKDKEIQYWKELYKSAQLAQRYGFPITEAESKSINEWQRKHDAKKHGLMTSQERLNAGGAIGGRYFYRFIPTSIGTSGECVCSSCHRAATLAAKGKNDEYRRQMEKLGGSYEFQELG